MSEQTESDTSGVYHLHGQLFYRHEDGKVFSSSISHIAQAYRDEAPFVFSFAEDVPADAERYSPREDSVAAARMDAWTEACDIHANPIAADVWARAVAVAHSGAASA